MRTSLDTNVLSALLGGEHNVLAVSKSLQESKSEGSLIVSAVVYAELFAYPGITEEHLAQLLAETGIEIQYRIDQADWIEAGRRYARYAHRRRTSTMLGPRRLLADFIIGAHALRHADRLMTFDIALYKSYFPELPLLTPVIA